MGATSVRRNLFHHNLSRRPVSAAPPNPVAQGGSDASNLQSRMLKSSSAESMASTLRSGPVDNGEIVVRDKNGSYELDIPLPLATIGNEDGDEMDANEAGVGSGTAVAAPESTEETEVSGREKEKIEASLVEMMCRNRNRQLSSEPTEILNLIQQSLRNKVAALEEDNWMYEPENEPRP